MSAQLYFIIFIVMAVLINVIIYGGITMAYTLEKRAAENRRTAAAAEAMAIAPEADRIGTDTAA